MNTEWCLDSYWKVSVNRFTYINAVLYASSVNVFRNKFISGGNSLNAINYKKIRIFIKHPYLLVKLITADSLFKGHQKICKRYTLHCIIARCFWSINSCQKFNLRWQKPSQEDEWLLMLRWCRANNSLYCLITSWLSKNTTDQWDRNDLRC